MSNVRAASCVAIGGAVCAAVAWSGVPGVSSVCAVLVILGLPVLAAVWSLEAGGRSDLIERSAFAFAGLALCCWSLWVAALVADPHGWAILASPVAASSMIIATTSSRLAGRQASQSIPSASTARRWTATTWMTAVVCVALVVVPFIPYGLHLADGVHRMGMTDWYKHLMVTTALRAPSFPPPNAFLISDVRAPYYYGFHLLASSLERAAAWNDSYPVLLGLTLVTAAALPLVLFVLARGLFGDRRRAAMAALGGTLFTGFDLVVWVLYAIRDTVAAWPLALNRSSLRAVVPSTNVEFWIHHNERQFDPPYISVIWAPQHVVAVLIALLTFHVVHVRSREKAANGSVLIPAIMLAALPALSAYVAIGFACGILGSVLLDCWRVRRAPWNTPTAERWWKPALLGIVATFPVAWVLAGSSSGHLVFAVPSAGTWLNGALFSTLLGDSNLTRLLDTPAVYLVEFGIVGLLGLASIRGRIAAREVSHQQREAIAVITTILVLVAIIRPPVGGPNNLYARPMLIAWSLLACFAADAWCAPRRRSRWQQVGAAIGAAGILAGAGGITAEGLAFWATPADSVEAARWINVNTAPGAVVVADPARHNLGIWLRRRIVVADRRHALLFGATPEQYDDTLARVRSALNATEPVDAARRISEVGADTVIVDSPAPTWAQPPCFEVGYRGPSVTVLSMDRAACTP